MDIVTYAIMTYGLTAIISLAVMAMLVAFSRGIGRNSEGSGENADA